MVYGSVPTNNREIAILSRSLLEVMTDLSSTIEVPESHVAEKRVNPTFKDESAMGVSSPLIRVHSGLRKPADAFVTLPYHGAWFWIDDRDIQSKRFFSFMMFVFTLTETGGKEGAPIVTIPAG